RLGPRGALAAFGRRAIAARWTFSALRALAATALTLGTRRPPLAHGLPGRVHLRVDRAERLFLLLVVLAFGKVVRDRRLATLEHSRQDPADRSPRDVAQREGGEELEELRRQQRDRAEEPERRGGRSQTAEPRAREHRVRDVADHQERERRHEEAQQ